MCGQLIFWNSGFSHGPLCGFDPAHVPWVTRVSERMTVKAWKNSSHDSALFNVFLVLDISFWYNWYGNLRTAYFSLLFQVVHQTARPGNCYLLQPRETWVKTVFCSPINNYYTWLFFFLYMQNLYWTHHMWCYWFKFKTLKKCSHISQVANSSSLGHIWKQLWIPWLVKFTASGIYSVFVFKDTFGCGVCKLKYLRSMFSEKRERTQKCADNLFVWVK